jgi:single-strand DNA-binding protein
MANVNKVILIGRLTKDPELRFTPQGTAVTDVSIAVNRVSRNPDGTTREETCFVDVTIWSKQAEATAEYVKKGQQIYIEGRLSQDRWEDKQTGQKRSKLKVIAERVQFLGGGGGRREEGGGGGAGGAEDVPPDAEPAEQSGGGDVPF